MNTTGPRAIKDARLAAILAQRLTNDAATAPTAEKRRSAEEALELLLEDIRDMKAVR